MYNYRTTRTMAYLMQSPNLGGAMEDVNRVDWDEYLRKDILKKISVPASFKRGDTIRLVQPSKLGIPVMPVLDPIKATKDQMQKKWFRIFEGEFTILWRRRNYDDTPWYEVETEQGTGFINSEALRNEQIEKVHHAK
jgi:hypothetical protein